MRNSSHQVSALVPDFTREQKKWYSWDPARSLIASIRCYQKHGTQKSITAKFTRVFAILRHRFWSVVTGADIPLKTKIGGGLLMPHPNGIVIHPDAIIGANCLIFQQVTIGHRSGGVPTVGGHVDIGTGAKILGKVNISDNSVIGANAVVLIDVPEGAIAVGVPARLIKKYVH